MIQVLCVFCSRLHPPAPCFLQRRRVSRQRHGQPDPTAGTRTSNPSCLILWMLPNMVFATHTNRGEHSTAQAQPISSQATARGAGHPAPFGSTVHYYWGIPFCPRGLDPDRYTQVGGAQRRLEVSEDCWFSEQWMKPGESASAPSGDRSANGGF